MSETVYSRKQIDEWQTKLAELADKPRTRFTKKQAVEALIEQIEQALTAHPYDQVAESLKEWGLDISPGSLKQYVNAYRRAHGSGATTATRKRSTGKGRKKAKATGASKRSQSAGSKSAVKTTQADTAAGDSKTAAGGLRKSNRTTADKTPDGFIEMSEDL